MINWLKMFFHCHKWKTVSSKKLDILDYGKVVSTGDRYIQQCELCGKLRKVDLA